MIPIRRPALTPLLSDQLRRKTELLGPAPDPGAARQAWSRADTVRVGLRETLSAGAFRPSFCMYCQESRGTDVDHYRPIMMAPQLVFSWVNHLLACGYCNQTAKREKFPLAADGSPLLLDPTVDDSGLHLTVSHSGELIPLTDRGEQTIDVLRLNARSDISSGRARVLAVVEQILRRARDDRRNLVRDEEEQLLCLCYLEVLHLFAHAIQRGDLSRLPHTRDLSRYAGSQMPTFRKLFPCCSL